MGQHGAIIIALAPIGFSPQGIGLRGGGMKVSTTNEHLLPLILKNFPVLILTTMSSGKTPPPSSIRIRRPLLIICSEKTELEDPPGNPFTKNSTSYTFPILHAAFTIRLSGVFDGLKTSIPSSFILKLWVNNALPSPITLKLTSIIFPETGLITVNGSFWTWISILWGPFDNVNLTSFGVLVFGGSNVAISTPSTKNFPT